MKGGYNEFHDILEEDDKEHSSTVSRRKSPKSNNSDKSRLAAGKMGTVEGVGTVNS